MIPYIILICIPIIVFIINDRVRLNSGNRTLYETSSLSIDIFMIVLILLVALRGLLCGIDTIQYKVLFRQYSLTDFSEILKTGVHEIGYRLLNKIVGLITDNYQYLLIVTSLACVCPIWYFYKKESEQPILTLSLFLTVAPFVLLFSGIRQAIAMAIGVFAWYMSRKKKPLLFICIVLIAMQFHTSAFILLFLYPLYHAKITGKWLWFVVPCMVAVYYLKDVIFAFLINFLWKDYQMTEETGAVTVLILLIVFAIYSYIIVDESLMDQETIALRNLLLFSVVLQMFAMLHPLSMRMNYYFLIFIPITIPKIIKRCKKKYEEIAKLSAAVMILFFYGYFIRTMIIDNDPLNIFPYIPFWKN